MGAAGTPGDVEQVSFAQEKQLSLRAQDSFRSPPTEAASDPCCRGQAVKSCELKNFVPPPFPNYAMLLIINQTQNNVPSTLGITLSHRRRLVCDHGVADRPGRAMQMSVPFTQCPITGHTYFGSL